MVEVTRRQTLALGAGAFITDLLAAGAVRAAGKDTLTIAFNVNLPSFDPTDGTSAVNPSIQAIYRSIFDQYIGQAPDLTFKPGILTAWGWNDDKTKLWMDVRPDVKWQDGSPLTPEDVVWSLERAGAKGSANPISFIWSTAGNYKIDGNRINADAIRFEPTFFMWMAFLTGYVLPKAYFEKVGAQGFEKKPIGSGPYMVDEYQGNAFLRLKANPHYWGEKPAFETVIFKFVPDATTRVAEIESGSSDITLEVPYEEFDRLKKVKGLSGVATPISDIGMIFITNKEPMLDKNVRLAAIMAIDKKAIVDRLLHGYGVPIETLEAPEYSAFDPSIKTPYDPKKAMELLAASGYSPEKPVKFTIQTTRGLKPKDYEMIQAIVGMWRKVGIEANIEVYEIAKHFELRTTHKLAPAAFYNWGDAIGDPTTSTGFAMFGPSPHSAFKTDDLDAKIGPLWGEKDEKKRIDGWKAVDAYIAEQGYVIPLLQYVQPIVYKSDLKVIPNKSGALQPTLVSPAT
jgi:peptide/nickel transport system substrate-binding protein